MENVGEKIYNLRKQKGVSQEELGFALNVSRQTISRWERDTVKPTVENLESLTKFFGVNSNYFLSEGLAADTNELDKQVAIKAVKKDLKIFGVVAVAVILAFSIIACSIAAYITVAPVSGQAVVQINRFNGSGIAFLAVGIFAAAMLITLLILIFKPPKK